ncbi:AMP-binding protein [Nocardia sp. NPDC127526]|uniref:AMP-binding protein n=1 Tax=Nocardia sp. NPDC127526 TaxID=3345393 RepID=UPI00363E08E2
MAMVTGINPRMLPALANLAELEPIPRLGAPVIVAPPLHHAYGFFGLLLTFLMGSTAIVHDRFDAEQVLADIERHGVHIAMLVPTMVKRIMDLPEDVRRDYATDSLQMALCGAAPMPPWLPAAFMEGSPWSRRTTATSPEWTSAPSKPTCSPRAASPPTHRDCTARSPRAV